MEARPKKLLPAKLEVLICACLLAVSALLFPSAAGAQEDLQYEIAPPPLKFVAKEEQARIDAEPNLKDRIKVTVSLMDARMTEAEKLNAAEGFDAMFTELGHFAGLLDYTLGYLAKQNPDDKKTLDSYKRIEISLRGFIGRLEVVRRDLPIKYEKYVRDLEKYLRTARSRALDPQFSDTVLPESKPQ
jgi:hypothetical protein